MAPTIEYTHFLCDVIDEPMRGWSERHANERVGHNLEIRLIEYTAGSVTKRSIALRVMLSCRFLLFVRIVPFLFVSC